MKKIPCKNCICFPICKNQVLKKTFTNEMYIRLSVLHRKCKVFAKWYSTVKYLNYYYIKEVKECFNAFYTTWDDWGHQ
jgi:hypothetical protein